jgi:hypothetical protein
MAGEPCRPMSDEHVFAPLGVWVQLLSVHSSEPRGHREVGSVLRLEGGPVQALSDPCAWMSSCLLGRISFHESCNLSSPVAQSRPCASRARVAELLPVTLIGLRAGGVAVAAAGAAVARTLRHARGCADPWRRCSGWRPLRSEWPVAWRAPSGVGRSAGPGCAGHRCVRGRGAVR